MKTLEEIGLKFNPFMEGEVYNYEDFKKTKLIVTTAVKRAIFMAESILGVPAGGKGLLLIQGEKGLGKTTVLYALKEHLDKRQIPNIYVSRISLLQWDQLKGLEPKGHKIEGGEVFLLVDIADVMHDDDMMPFAQNIDNLVRRGATVFIAMNESQRIDFEGETHSLSFGKFQNISLPKFDIKDMKELLEARLKPAQMPGISGLHPFGEKDVNYVQLSCDGVPRAAIKFSNDILYALINEEMEKLKPPHNNLLSSRTDNPHVIRQSEMILDFMHRSDKNAILFDDIANALGVDMTEPAIRRRLRYMESNNIIYSDTLEDGKTRVYSLYERDKLYNKK